MMELTDEAENNTNHRNEGRRGKNNDRIEKGRERKIITTPKNNEREKKSYDSKTTN